MTITTQDFLKQNAPRLAGLSAHAIAVFFAINSIVRNETETDHTNYNIAYLIGPTGGIFNVIGRILDHYHDQKKQWNIIAGAGAIFFLSLEIAFSTASLFSKFNQPIMLPQLISSALLLLVAGINWEHATDKKDCHERIRKNAGRIATVPAVFTAIGCSIGTITNSTQERKFFFAANTALTFASICNSSSRVYDIVKTHQEKTNQLNKACAVLFFLITCGNVAASLFATTGVWATQPIAFSMTLESFSLILYTLAQLRFSNQSNKYAPIAPATEVVEIDNEDTNTAESHACS